MIFTYEDLQKVIKADQEHLEVRLKTMEASEYPKTFTPEEQEYYKIHIKNDCVRIAALKYLSWMLQKSGCDENADIMLANYPFDKFFPELQKRNENAAHSRVIYYDGP